MTPKKLNDLRNKLLTIIEAAQAGESQRKRAGCCLDGQLPAESLPGALHAISDHLIDIIAEAGRCLATLREEEQPQ